MLWLENYPFSLSLEGLLSVTDVSNSKDLASILHPSL